MAINSFRDNKTKFQSQLRNCNNIVISSGAGISAESGIETFRGEKGIWKKLKPEELATFSAFSKNPEIVWEEKGRIHYAALEPGTETNLINYQPCIVTRGALTRGLATIWDRGDNILKNLSFT